MFARIESDGGFGTSITPEGGKPLQGVREITWRAAVNDVCRAEVVLDQIEFSGLAQTRIFVTDPDTGESKEVKSISFADGSEWVAP